MKTNQQITQELERLNFQVELEKVFFTCQKSEDEALQDTYFEDKESKAVVGYGNPDRILTSPKALFSIVSDRYLLIRNEDFFPPMYEGIKEYVEVEDINISTNSKGSYYVEFLIDERILNLGKIGLLAINSYDGTASSQINLFVKFKQGEKETNVFLDFNFKHKHTKNNTYKEQLGILRNRTALVDKLNTLFTELHTTQLQKVEFIRICNNIKLPKMYMDAIVNSLYFNQSVASCLSVYLTMSSVLDGMEIIRKINFLNNVLRGIRTYKQEISTLELD